MTRSDSLTAAIDLMHSHAPFNQMVASTHLEYMAVHLTLGFYANDEVILSPDTGAAGLSPRQHANDKPGRAWIVSHKESCW